MKIFYLSAILIILPSSYIVGSQSDKKKHKILVFGEREVGKTVLIAGLRGHKLSSDKNHAEIGSEPDPSKDKWAKRVRENFIFIEKSAIDDEVCDTTFKGIIVVDYSNASDASHLDSVRCLMNAFNLSKQPNPPFCLVISVGSQEPDHYGGLHRLLSMCKKIDSPENSSLYKEEKDFFNIVLHNGINSYPATTEEAYEEAEKSEQEIMLEEIKSKGNHIIIFDPSSEQSIQSIAKKLDAFAKREGVNKAAFLRPHPTPLSPRLSVGSHNIAIKEGDIVSDLATLQEVSHDHPSQSAPVNPPSPPSRQDDVDNRRIPPPLDESKQNASPMNYAQKNDVRPSKKKRSQVVIYASTALPLLTITAFLAYYSPIKKRKTVRATRNTLFLK